MVDLDTSKIVHAMGDESSILPLRLQKGIRSALQLVSSNTKSGDGIRNFLVSEAFMRVFIETCSHCDSHLVTQQDGKVIFQVRQKNNLKNFRLQVWLLNASVIRIAERIIRQGFLIENHSVLPWVVRRDNYVQYFRRRLHRAYGRFVESGQGGR